MNYLVNHTERCVSNILHTFLFSTTILGFNRKHFEVQVLRNIVQLGKIPWADNLCLDFVLCPTPLQAKEES